MWIDLDAWLAAISALKTCAGIPLRPFKDARQLLDFQGLHARDGSERGSRDPSPKGPSPFEHNFFNRH
jgi:hypothetical protein